MVLGKQWIHGWYSDGLEKATPNNKAMEKAIECKMHQEEEEPVRSRDSVPDLTTGVQNGDLDDLSSGGTS